MNRPILAILSAATLLSGCQTPSAPPLSETALIAAALAEVPAADRIEVAAAVAIEVGVRFRCPRTTTETVVLGLARTAFDQLARPRISSVSSGIVDDLRAAANAACGL